MALKNSWRFVQMDPGAGVILQIFESRSQGLGASEPHPVILIPICVLRTKTAMQTVQTKLKARKISVLLCQIAISIQVDLEEELFPAPRNIWLSGQRFFTGHALHFAGPHFCWPSLERIPGTAQTCHVRTKFHRPHASQALHRKRKRKTKLYIHIYYLHINQMTQMHI